MIGGIGNWKLVTGNPNNGWENNSNKPKNTYTYEEENMFVFVMW